MRTQLPLLVLGMVGGATTSGSWKARKTGSALQPSEGNVARPALDVSQWDTGWTSTLQKCKVNLCHFKPSSVCYSAINSRFRWGLFCPPVSVYGTFLESNNQKVGWGGFRFRRSTSGDNVLKLTLLSLFTHLQPRRTKFALWFQVSLSHGGTHRLQLDRSGPPGASLQGTGQEL